MKYRIFFGLSGGMGPVMRCMPIAEEFRTKGAEVAFSIYDPQAAAYIRAQGYMVLDDDDPTMPARENIIPPANVFYHLDHYYAQMGLLDEAFAEAFFRHRIRMLVRFRPHLIFADMSPHTLVAAAHLRIPSVSITQSCFIPEGKPLCFWGEAPRNLPRVTPVVNRVLRRIGQPAITCMEELNVGTLNIIPGIPETDPVAGKNVRHVGPIETRHSESEWHDIPDEPYILVYPGRLQDSSGLTGERLVEAVIEAYSNRPEQVIIANRDPLPAHLEKSLSDNMLHIPYFTERWLNRCSLFIHHGGHGSCLSAVMHGVPSLIIPTHTEREFNARMLSDQGVCEYMIPGTFTMKHLVDLATHIIADDYRERARLLRSEVKHRYYGGAAEVYCRSMALIHTAKDVSK